MNHATNTWTDAARTNVRELQDVLIAVAQAAKDAGADREMLDGLLSPYRDLIDSMYERDMTLARLVDNSDLLLHVHGPAASGPTPRVSVLTRMLTQTRDEVTKLAKHMGGITTVRVPAALDMGLVGVAGGSLFLGFSAIEGSDDAAITRGAVEAIGVASGLIADEASLQTIAKAFPDPATRDMAVSAVRHLSPSGQIGIKEVDLLGRSIKRAVVLSIDTRRSAKKVMSEAPPKKAAARVSFIGTVREADLDAARFEIRNVDGYTEDVRCAHELPEDEVQALMMRRVRVSGTPEHGANGTVRLLWVDEVEIVDD